MLKFYLRDNSGSTTMLCLQIFVKSENISPSWTIMLYTSILSVQFGELVVHSATSSSRPS